MGSKRLLDGVTWLLGLGALLMVAATVRREMTRSQRPLAIGRASTEPNWRHYATHGNAFGSATSDVTIIEFADFECPYCKKLSRYVDSLQLLGKDVRVIYRHFPSHTHIHALSATRASECAANQKVFERMYAALIAYPDSFNTKDWHWFGEKANIPDLEAFDQCTRSSSPIPALAQDTIDGLELGIKGTPTILINEQRYNGLPSFDSLVVYVDRVRQAVRHP